LNKGVFTAMSAIDCFVRGRFDLNGDVSYCNGMTGTEACCFYWQSVYTAMDGGMEVCFYCLAERGNLKAINSLSEWSGGTRQSNEWQ
jgi:hypothetical protein